MSTQLTIEDCKKLSAPFPRDKIGVKVNSFSKDKTKAMLVCYLQHTDVYGRIEEVDPTWSVTVLDEKPYDQTVFTRVKLTIKGSSRENVGEGGDPKSALSDAIKRAAMLFGVGRYLYDSETVWVLYNEHTDRFKSWTLADFEKALRPGQERTPTAESDSAKANIKAGTPFRPTAAPSPIKAVVKDKKAIEAEIFKLGTTMGMSSPQTIAYAEDLVGKPAARLTSQDLEQVLADLQAEAGRNGFIA